MSDEKPKKGLIDLFDFNNPFFKPLWIRVSLVVFLIGWTLFEFSGGNTFWAGLFAFMAAAAFWGLFMSFNPRDDA